jgi:uncharacterized protein with HEPN domain
VKAERNPADYLSDILDVSGKISKFIGGLDSTRFAADEKTFFAVIRGLEMIGEAARKIPPSVRQKYPQIPWREITGMRDKLIHDYMGVNVTVVWKTVTEDLPALEPRIREMLNELGG